MEARADQDRNIQLLPQDLKARLDRGEKVVLLDVREPWEHQTARIEGSILIPLRELPRRAAEIDREAEVVLYCHHGVRSMSALHFLRQQGFHRLKNLVGGIDAWSQYVDPTVPRYR